MPEQAQQPDPALDEIDMILGTIDRESKRIKSIPEPTPERLHLEMTGTVLPLLKRLAHNSRAAQHSIAPLFSVVTQHAEDIDELFKRDPGGEESQLDEDHAKLFTTICEALKLLVSEFLEGRAPGQDPEAKQKLRELLGLAEEGIKLVDELTLHDVEDEAEGPE